MNNTIPIVAISIGVTVASLAVLLASQSTNYAIKPNIASEQIKSNLDPTLLKLPNRNLTDDQLIAKTHDLQEIKTFLSRYPDAKVVGVSRLYELKSDARNIGVGYEVDRTIDYLNGTTVPDPCYATVDFDRDSNETLSVQSTCN